MYVLLQFQNFTPLPSPAVTGIVTLLASLRRNDIAWRESTVSAFDAVKAFPFNAQLKTGAVILVVDTIVPFGYISEYPPPPSHDHSHPAPIQPVAAISQVT